LVNDVPDGDKMLRDFVEASGGEWEYGSDEEC